MNTEIPVRYSLLRDDTRWVAELAGLDLSADGSLELSRVPAPAKGESIHLPGPYDVEPSGIAVDQCGSIYLSDGEQRHIHMIMAECDFHYALTVDGAPAGLAVNGETLYVADRANARILCFLFPSLELRHVIEGGFLEPTGLAVDGQARLYVLDRGAKKVVRFLSDGTPDATYNAVMDGYVGLNQPAFLTVSGEDVLYVSESTSNTILKFDKDGIALGSLSAAGHPRALTVSKTQLYVADVETGRILVYETITGKKIGEIPDFCATVTALVVDNTGHIYIKNNAGESFVRLDVDAGCVTSGTVAAGPLDAGVVSDWERVVADVQGAGLELRAIVSQQEIPAPTPAQWNAPEALLPSSDSLIFREALPEPRDPGERRFLWLRAVLQSEDGRTSPRLQQLQAQTVGTSLIEKLPRIYQRDDAEHRFLERLLALARSEFEDWDAALGNIPRRIDPETVPMQDLDWLAQWLAFKLPQGLQLDAGRQLLARLPQLYANRGTEQGIRDFAKIYSGLQPSIFEAYRARRIWKLAEAEEETGTASMLGFDTALAAAAPEGIVLPGHVCTDPTYMGLRGDYYAGYEFERHVMSRTDLKIEFDEIDDPLMLREENADVEPFSVRWSGQIKPRYSETYLFVVTPAAGVRLWIDGYPLIDDWDEQAMPGDSGRFYLDADRWHAIMLEVHRTKGGKGLLLEWSSRSQPEETVPAQCLYSVLDDRADLSSETTSIVDVGNAVVGESGPLAGSEYGSMLFSEYAHLFTVLAPAGCCDASKREALREVIEAEKPAHTDYHLCFVEPRMRVGFQARLGIDAIVADGPVPLRLGESKLGKDSYLEAAVPGGARVAARARLGKDTVVG